MNLSFVTAVAKIVSGAAAVAAIAFLALGTAGTAVGIPNIADEERFLHYLDTRGYHARYSNGSAVPHTTTIMYGHYVCNNLRSRGHAGTSTLLQFELVIEAAQRELCPETLP